MLSASLFVEDVDNRRVAYATMRRLYYIDDVCYRHRIVLLRPHPTLIPLSMIMYSSPIIIFI